MGSSFGGSIGALQTCCDGGACLLTSVTLLGVLHATGVHGSDFSYGDIGDIPEEVHTPPVGFCRHCSADSSNDVDLAFACCVCTDERRRQAPH